MNFHTFISIRVGLLIGIQTKRFPKVQLAKQDGSFVPSRGASSSELSVQGREGSALHKVTQGPRLLPPGGPAGLRITIQNVVTTSLELYLVPLPWIGREKGEGKKHLF